MAHASRALPLAALLSAQILLAAAAAAHVPNFVRMTVDGAYGGNGKPGFVRAGDVDGDGDKDLVAGGGRALFVYENTGDGTTWPRWGVGSAGLDSTGAMGANGAVLFDVDGDGDLDVVSALFQSDVGWWENPGVIGHAPWSFHPILVTGRYLHDILLADLDDDGDAREFVLNLNRDYFGADITLLWIRPGADPGSTWEIHSIEPDRNEGPAHGHAGLDVADIDEDGNTDLVYSNGWYRAPADPTTGSWTWHPATSMYGISNALAHDMDDDGDPDVVVSGGHHGQGVVWLENTGAPQAPDWPRHPISTISGDPDQRWYYDANANVLQHPECLALEDMDLDGTVEVVTCDLFFGEDPGEPGWSQQVHSVYIYSKEAAAEPWFRQTIAPNTFPSHLLQLVDVDGDARRDIISESAGHGVVSWFRREVDSPSCAEALGTTDSDGDGVPDPCDNCRLVGNGDQSNVDGLADDDRSAPGRQHYGDVCDADLDNDGRVGASDFFGVFLPCLRPGAAILPGCEAADMDGDGQVGPADFFRMRPAFGTLPGPGIDE